MCEKKIIEQVTKYFGLSGLTKERTEDMCQAKWAAVYLLKTETNLPLKAIAPLLGLGTPNAAGVSFTRSLRELQNNRCLKDDVANINEKLKQLI